MAVNVKTAVFWDVPLHGLWATLAFWRWGAAGPFRTSVGQPSVTAQNVVVFVDTVKYVYFEFLALLECCAAKLVVGYRHFGIFISVPFSWPLKMGPECCPDTLVTDYEPTLRNIPSKDPNFIAAEACNLVTCILICFVKIPGNWSYCYLQSCVQIWRMYMDFHLVIFVPNFSTYCVALRLHILEFGILIPVIPYEIYIGFRHWL